jgi:hypothetical protein
MMRDEYDLDAIDVYIERFAHFGARGVNPAELSDDQLMTILPVVALVGDSDDPEHKPRVAFAEAVAHEVDSRIRRHQAAAPAALAWLNRNDQVGKTYLVARLYCPKGKQLARMYCLPKDVGPTQDSGGHRLLIVPALTPPSGRGQHLQPGSHTSSSGHVPPKATPGIRVRFIDPPSADSLPRLLGAGTANRRRSNPREPRTPPGIRGAALAVNGLP